MSRGNFLRIFRIGLLLYVLAMVVLGAWLSRSRSTDWDATLWVAVYPINADGSGVTADYIARLRIESFQDINDFVAGEARRYGVELDDPVTMELADLVAEQPPATPVGGHAIAVMWWSLRLRYWAWRIERAQARPASMGGTDITLAPLSLYAYWLQRDPTLGGFHGGSGGA